MLFLISVSKETKAWPALPPFQFKRANDYIKKEMQRLKNQKASKKKVKSTVENTLEDQLNKMLDAGLVLSPGISVDDFLMIESEESYKAEPYTHLCWQLTNRNEEGVIFCPLEFDYGDYHLPEREYMDSFQRICAYRSIAIENIESEDYEENDEEQDEDEEAEGLRQIRFTANREEVIWNFGPDPSHNKYYEWLGHAQRFFQDRFDDMLIYEISGVYRLLCLPKASADKISKLIRISPIEP
jgi:hypothetical protein